MRRAMEHGADSADGLFHPGGTLRPAAMAVLFPFVLSMMPTLFASFYASYRDIFASVPAPESPGDLPPMQ